jgi:UDP-3-O-[3-hydroxymyristoyl] glucosamine N-acyltransferase
MQFTAQQIAQLIQGEVQGNELEIVHSFGKIEEAQNGQISFFANAKYEEYIYTTKASVLILNKNFTLRNNIEATIIRVEDAYSAFAKLLDFYQNNMQKQFSGIEQPSFLNETAKYGENLYVAAFAYLSKNVQIGNNCSIFPQVFLGENVQLGNNVTLHSGVKIYKDCIIGNHVTIHAGSVIGADGFGFAPQADGSFKKVPQLGNVVIEDNVEIGANTTIDRGTIGSTIIKKGVKLDNLIQIAHNVEIGENTVLAAQVGISGSTKIGKNVMMGHISIADGTKVAGQSGITKSVKQANTALTGNPAAESKQVLRTNVLVKKLPELEKRVGELEKRK